jgi:DNA processing protein
LCESCIAIGGSNAYSFSMMSLSESRESVEDSAYRPPDKVKRLVVVAPDGAHVPELYAAGDAELLRRRGVAVVGSRQATPEGRFLAWQVARALAAKGIVVVSGLALGIDRAAHAGAIDAGGRTIGVIGTALDRVYPSAHARLQELIYREHLLVSPFALGARTSQGHFPARNRVIARVADAVVLVEAGEKSGTVHAVREALRLGRPVLVSEQLFGGCGVSWVWDLAKNPGLQVWAAPSDVLKLLVGA